jgi:hypothetical protein
MDDAAVLAHVAILEVRLRLVVHYLRDDSQGFRPVLREYQFNHSGAHDLLRLVAEVALECGADENSTTLGIHDADGIEQHLARFQADYDDYSTIILKALADRLAEAFAEHMHERVRKEFWGFVPTETLSNDELIAEKYRGIRPAPGYPACPEHTEKATLFKLLDVTRNTGIELTEGFSMYPAAAVSGWYYSHPDSQYFVVGRLGKEQIEDYAKRKGWTVAEAERWLGANLDYEPE